MFSVFWKIIVVVVVIINQSITPLSADPVLLDTAVSIHFGNQGSRSYIV